MSQIIKSDNPGSIVMEEIPIGNRGESGIKLTVSNAQYEVWAAMTHTEAMAVGEALSKHAYHAATGLDRDGRVVMGNMAKQTCLNRATLFIKNNPDKAPGYVANAVLDMMLSVVL